MLSPNYFGVYPLRPPRRVSYMGFPLIKPLSRVLSDPRIWHCDFLANRRVSDRTSGGVSPFRKCSSGDNNKVDALTELGAMLSEWVDVTFARLSSEFTFARDTSIQLLSCPVESLVTANEQPILPNVYLGRE